MKPAAYYNEIDPFAAQWLRNLIAGGHIAPGCGGFYSRLYGGVTWPVAG